MKVKMMEHYRDAACTLVLGDTVEVGDSLGAWLVENRKAELIVEVAPIEPVEPPAEPAPKQKRGRQ